MFRRHPFYRHRLIFFILRRLLGTILSLGKQIARVTGLFFQVKGKVSGKGGIRKKIYKAWAGKFTSATLKIFFKYRFRQV